MKKLILLALAALGTVAGRAQTYDIEDAGKLTVYYEPALWTVKSEQLPNHFELLFTPKGNVNASGSITVLTLDDDPYNTKAKLRDHLIEMYDGIAEGSVERKVTPRELFLKSGVGYSSDFTDKEMVGKPPERNNFKVATFGVIRLEKNIYVSIALFADSFKEDAYQRLLGTVEGMEFVAGSTPPQQTGKPAAPPPAKSDAGPSKSQPAQKTVSPVPGADLGTGKAK